MRIHILFSEEEDFSGEDEKGNNLYLHTVWKAAV